MTLLSEAIEKVRRFCPPALNSGLLRSEINTLLLDFPYQLPDEVYEFYSLSDGLGEVSKFSTQFGVFSLSQAVDNYRSYVKDYSRYSEEWFPLVELEDHLFVMPCNQGAYNLIDLGDDFTAFNFANDESSAFYEFRTLTTTVVSAAACFEREFEMRGKCWVERDIFYPYQD